MYELDEDKLYGYAKLRKMCARFLESALPYASTTRIAIICDNFSTHLRMAKDTLIETWAKANTAEIARTRGSFPG